ncbi:15246_t:CDS:2 [Racocetra persica]|uniref:15246_t:CDS:1 n=1 Tax=Racocetra persica TaxID=160502 RepID=A0ACA9REZ5_9GLOM|nr:15246_t:CDS:2 [Racocetra persica]
MTRCYKNNRRTRLQNSGTSSLFEALELVQKDKARLEKDVRRLTRKIQGLNSDLKRLIDSNGQQESYINDIKQKLKLLEMIRKQQEERIKSLEHEKEVRKKE